MPRLNGTHSTSCCGAHSFSGFDATCDRDPNLINAAMVGAPVGRLGDLTLNGDQVRRPGMMQRLADLGFVLDAHWINSVHGSHVYRFTRCDSRRPLLDGPIAGNWNGMVLTQDLTGDLPRIQQGAANGVPRRGRDLFQIGDRVHVHEGMRNERDFDIEGIVEDGRGGYLARMRDDRNGNAMFRISFNNLTLREGVERRNQAAQPAVRPQRHENARVAALAAERPAPAAPAVRDRVVFSTFHCVFRNGRRGAGYDTQEQARENLGRRTRIDRRDIRTNGDPVWTTVAR